MWIQGDLLRDQEGGNMELYDIDFESNARIKVVGVGGGGGTTP